tara:strand:- start:226790 stop:227389 length:600 start_codon:yes stop_codon:yes gene_type:complete
MISKSELIECSITNFTKFGSKRFTLDELAKALGISKKSIYNYFDSKEDLVVESVFFLTEGFKSEVKTVLQSQKEDPILSIILIYKMGFEKLRHFKPSFIFGLKKYYPKASKVFDEFRDCIVNKTVFRLLETAQDSGIIKSEVNLHLFCDLYFNRFEEIVFKNNNFIEPYSNKELLDHFVVYNLKGIVNSNYTFNSNIIA